MSARQLYEYAIIRIVPRVERGERINAGVILYCASQKYLGMRYEINEHKIKALNMEADIEEIKNALEGFEKVCCGKDDSGPIGSLNAAERFRWLTAKRSTLIQVSEVHPGFTIDPEKKLNELFIKLVQ